ncbi:hypothetical protein COCOR_05489 [Corallococcus coralloides DSM 2259]|uniref:Lipoprotein n=1 Tax=Corallococcus coralloides (strain ATCC 25202 / DSM 2259 / NBRC 100086 / M2) TaxID=1144275 RepID=H8MZ53_CORCM|nr:hypothetical protein [Corallococcus coralloides]AFE06405.1 hypothetical protein COCOR_05489 [Corallococcus coralloides DSM 2259]
MNALRILLSFFTVLTFGLGCGADPAPRESPKEPGASREDALSAPPASPRSTLAAFSTVSSSQVYYLDPVSTVFELSSQGSEWKFSWLPGSAKPGSALTAFPLANSAPRVYFISNDSRVHELWWDGTWHDHALVTQAGDPPPAAADSPLVGFVRSGYNPSVYYVAAHNRHVHELKWNGLSWGVTDVTERAGAPAAAPGSPLTAFTVKGGEARVYFVGNSRHVHELWENSDGAWAQQDLNLVTNAPAADNDTALTGFATDGTWSHVYYVGDSNRHVIELKFTSQGWTYTNVTPLGAPYTTAPATALTSFAVNPGSHPRVYFLLDSNAVGELWSDGASWHLNNLTVYASAPAAKVNSPLAGFAINGVFSRVYYLAGNDNVMQLAWSGSNWGVTSLTTIAN